MLDVRSNLVCTCSCDFEHVSRERVINRKGCAYAAEMSDFRAFTRDFVEQFINMYREEECLWKTTLKEYSDKGKRNAAYDRLILLCKTVEPNIDRNGVIKKINSLRASWRREKKKIDDSKRSGKGTAEVYEPRLWYFSLLTFLEEQIVPMSSISNIESTSSDYDCNLPTPDTQVFIYFLMLSYFPAREQLLRC